MPVTPDDKMNERLKLGATFANNTGVALITTGVLAPSFQLAFGLIPSTISPNQVNGTGLVCVVAGLGLHGVGQWLLGDLR
jgi:hypothetical protein